LLGLELSVSLLRDGKGGSAFLKLANGGSKCPRRSKFISPEGKDRR
jgi:hypothetical protein